MWAQKQIPPLLKMTHFLFCDFSRPLLPSLALLWCWGSLEIMTSSHQGNTAAQDTRQDRHTTESTRERCARLWAIDQPPQWGAALILTTLIYERVQVGRFCSIMPNSKDNLNQNTFLFFPSAKYNTALTGFFFTSGGRYEWWYITHSGTRELAPKHKQTWLMASQTARSAKWEQGPGEHWCFSEKHNVLPLDAKAVQNVNFMYNRVSNSSQLDSWLPTLSHQRTFDSFFKCAIKIFPAVWPPAIGYRTNMNYTLSAGDKTSLKPNAPIYFNYSPF